MLFAKFKKGTAWLRRDFEEDLKERLSENLTADLNDMVNFPGRDKIVANMLSREELEEANYSDIQEQKRIDTLRKKQSMVEQTRQEEIAKEEAALRKAMDL
jgi:hypothetical protein